jgi:CHAD domain-containing protein
VDMTTIVDQTWRTNPIGVGEDSTAGEVLTGYLREQVTALRVGEVAVRGAEPDGTHEMRVAARRLGSVLGAFREVYPKAGRGRVRELAVGLKWLSDVLGPVRDAEVLEQRLAAEVNVTPTELVLGPVSAELNRHLAKGTAVARADLMSALDSPRYADLLVALDTFLVVPPSRGLAGKPGADVLRPLVGKAHRRARRATRKAGNATGSARDDALHGVRRKVRRARYAAEAVAPVVGRPAERYVRRSKKVQQTLGDQHDIVALRHALRDLGAQAYLDGTNSFTFGLLHGRIGMAAAQREHEFIRRWRKLGAGKASRWLHR